MRTSRLPDRHSEGTVLPSGVLHCFNLICYPPSPLPPRRPGSDPNSGRPPFQLRFRGFMANERNRVCPVELADSLDTIHNPKVATEPAENSSALHQRGNDCSRPGIRSLLLFVLKRRTSATDAIEGVVGLVLREDTCTPMVRWNHREGARAMD
jgi:hypothetical protein